MTAYGMTFNEDDAILEGALLQGASHMLKGQEVKPSQNR